MELYPHKIKDRHLIELGHFIFEFQYMMFSIYDSFNYFIVERVIAMSFPSKGLMSMYRNDINVSNNSKIFIFSKKRDHYHEN